MIRAWQAWRARRALSELPTDAQQQLVLQVYEEIRDDRQLSPRARALLAELVLTAAAATATTEACPESEPRRDRWIVAAWSPVADQLVLLLRETSR